MRKTPTGEVLVIGDTPADVDAARTAGAAVLGMATGSSSGPDLLAAGADAMLTTLAETETFLALVANGIPAR